MTPRRARSKPDARPPLLGALLRQARRRLLERVFEALERDGFGDLREAHMAVLQYPGPDGVTPLELARRAQMSKQAMNQLLGTLERAGYLVRKRHPRHGKQRIVRLTARGKRVLETIRASVHDVESDFARKLGARRYATMLACLRDLTG